MTKYTIVLKVEVDCMYLAHQKSLTDVSKAYYARAIIMIMHRENLTALRSIHQKKSGSTT